MRGYDSPSVIHIPVFYISVRTREAFAEADTERRKEDREMERERRRYGHRFQSPGPQSSAVSMLTFRK